MPYSPTIPGGGAASYILWHFFGLGAGLREGAMWEDLSLEKYVMGQEKFNEKDAGFSSITIKKKNNEKINMKKFFSIETKELH